MKSVDLRSASAILAAALLYVPASSAPVRSRAFTLTAERSSYLLGEPVYLRIQSAEPATPSLEEGTVLLAIKCAGEGERIYRPPLRLRGTPAAPARMPESSGGSVRFARIIFSDGELVFGKPGRYRLRLLSAASSASAGPGKVPGSGTSQTNGDAAGLALSDSLAVVFREPTLPPDKQAYAIISRNPGEYGLAVYLEGGDQLRQGLAIMSDLAASQSAYSRVASFVLSSDWSQDFTDYRGPHSRPIDLQKALAWAQWDRSQGAYIPLRNAYRLKSGADILAGRNPSAPGLDAVRGKLAGFMASLTPEEAAWFRSFSPPVPTSLTAPQAPSK